MSFVHYLFLGHFEHDGESVRFAKNPSDAAYTPVVHRPLDTEIIKAVLRETRTPENKDAAFPDEWGIWMEDGYLVCDKYTKSPEAMDFLARLVDRTECEIYDVAAHCALTLDQWLSVAHGCSRS